MNDSPNTKVLEIDNELWEAYEGDESKILCALWHHHERRSSLT